MLGSCWEGSKGVCFFESGFQRSSWSDSRDRLCTTMFWLFVGPRRGRFLTSGRIKARRWRPRRYKRAGIRDITGARKRLRVDRLGLGREDRLLPVKITRIVLLLH